MQVSDTTSSRHRSTVVSHGQHRGATYRKVVDQRKRRIRGQPLDHWKEHLGHVRLDRITRALVNSYIARRQVSGRSGRTVNLEVICFRNVMKRAIDDGWITSLPTQNLRPLKWTPHKRGLFSEAEIQGVAAGAVEESKNGQEFADYLLLLAYSGVRRTGLPRRFVKRGCWPGGRRS